MTWDKNRDFLSPIAKTIMSNLERCFEGDRSARDAIVEAFRDDILTTRPITMSELNWARTAAEELFENKQDMLNHPLYLEGYKEGLEWPDIWDKHSKPGGPTPLYMEEENKKYGRDYWCLGWEAGFSEKKNTGRSNPPRR